MTKLLSSLLIPLFLIGTPAVNTLFAADTTDPVIQSAQPQSYETYQNLVKEQCDATDKQWNNPKDGGPIVAPPQYAKLEASSINRTIAQAVAGENLPSEREKLAKELDLIRIGNISTLKSVEIARLQYRSAMNNIFACAIIDSRTLMLADLRKKINEKFPSPNNEILLKLEREEKKLQATRNSLPCTATETSGKTAIPVETRIANSTSRQFCHFNYYLLYLRDNLEKNNIRMMEIEKAVGTGSGTNIAINSDTWLRELTARTSQISDELGRAADTLPRAIRTYQEMKRTFAVHIMLVIIYDDYLRLRSNLNTYFNATSQLFEKANNAQNTNSN